MTKQRSGEDVECETCGKVFYVVPSRLKKNKFHTCSRKCMGILNAKIYSRKVKTNCGSCGKEIFYKQSHFKIIANHTCSRTCRAKLISTKYKGRGNPRSLNLTDFERIFWDRSVEYRRKSEIKGIESDIDYTFLIDLFNKQEGKCYYTGIDLNLDKKNKTFKTMSLDKIDPNKGYVKDNVVFCINSINMMKSDFSLDDVECIFNAIYEKRKKELNEQN